MEQHVQEMLDLGHHSAQAPYSTNAAPFPNNTTIKAYIVREISARVDSKLGAIVDTAIMARMNHPEASQKTEQTKINTLQTSRNYDRRILNDLDSLHRHERTLNTALVGRLFQTTSLEGDPDARFNETTFDLQSTDSVNSVLVSHVETLVVKVQRLEAQVKELQEALRGTWSGLISFA
ncbi:uncharacterized protein EKO05_0009323 [Ascochyta rabiei]|uniref:uncharacterized protein n=1 Tax=Didymella rabiei TaxID=5454 RepID=UPI00220D9871|nr:uncharacterized protein EKO05_0009323 [Ascochyta rabiei]UPX19047.1 hypothetical protein EKO05_0009323 [Ascochyta rabiei]